MNSQARAIVSFTLLGTLLVAIAWFVSGLPRWGSGVASLPAAPSSVAVLEPAPVGPLPAPPPGPAPLLLQTPSLSKTQIAFSFAGEICTDPRDGGVAPRLVTGQLRNYRPLFSPDGSRIAFTADLDGNTDVYVVPAAGGEAKRLTFHPSHDVAVGWMPDGSRILMASWRATERDLPKLYTLSTDGGPPEQLPLPSGIAGSYSPDGKRLAYIPHQQWQPQWRNYRGGQTTPIWVADLSDSHVVKVPRDNSNDRFPMWVDNTLYFVSDRNGPFTLFSWDPASAGTPKEILRNPDGLEVRYASAGPGGIVYEQLGELHILDFATGTTHPVPVTIAADLPGVRPHFQKVEPSQVLSAAVSPTGKRVLFEAHGEILALPAEKGDVRNLTRTPAVADRDPSWSPDGKWIAWLSDADGEYALYFRAPDGIATEKKVDLGAPGSFFYGPVWSPDSKKIALTDKRLNLWLIDIEHPKLEKIDKNPFEYFGPSGFDPSWSPDSKWIAYEKHLDNHLPAVFLYSLEDKSIHQVTDGRSAAYAARFDRSGKYLWFLSSTDVGEGASEAMMTSMGHAITSSVYAAVLSKDDSSPVAPESDEENADEDKEGKGKLDKGDKGGKGGDKGEKGKSDTKPVHVDFDGLDQRIVALPIERAHYEDLQLGPSGSFFLVSIPVAFADEDYIEFDDDNLPPVDVQRYDVKKRKVEPFVEKIDGTFVTSFDGKKVLYSKDKRWMLVDADGKGGGKDDGEGDGALKSANGLEVWVDPRAEWKQMFHEVWRIERDFMYDPHHHGLDLAAAEKFYARYLPGIAARDDLNDLLGDALANLVLGHVWAFGGDMPKQEHVNVGLLGADYRVDQGHYQIARILKGENWNPRLKAPLTQPKVDVKEGDYLLAINGEELRGDDDVSRLLMGRAGKQTVITVGARPNRNGARQVTVVPVGSESGLRLRDWMESSRKKVDELSGGRVGYVFVPDTAGEGRTNFDRYYFSQVGKDGAVIDERFNHGGYLADYIVNVLKQHPLMGATTRDGRDEILPQQAIFGPTR